jgi:hypothetical protein
LARVPFTSKLPFSPGLFSSWRVTEPSFSRTEAVTPVSREFSLAAKFSSISRLFSIPAPLM